MEIIDFIKRQINPIKYYRKKGAKIGHGCEIYRTVSIDSEPYLVEIGNNVRINSGCHLITHDGGCWVIRNCKSEFADVDLFGKITIGNNVSIGTNSMILPNVSIGDNVIVGAGSIVTHDIPPNSVVAGAPARMLETIEDYFEKHQNEFVHTKRIDKKQKRKYLEEHFN